MENCAFESDNKCTALKVKKCKGCNFYKTKEELKNEHSKTVERLKSKGLYEYIKGKYIVFSNYTTNIIGE